LEDLNILKKLDKKTISIINDLILFIEDNKRLPRIDTHNCSDRIEYKLNLYMRKLHYDNYKVETNNEGIKKNISLIKKLIKKYLTNELDLVPTYEDKLNIFIKALTKKNDLLDKTDKYYSLYLKYLINDFKYLKNKNIDAKILNKFIKLINKFKKAKRLKKLLTNLDIVNKELKEMIKNLAKKISIKSKSKILYYSKDNFKILNDFKDNIKVKEFIKLYDEYKTFPSRKLIDFIINLTNWIKLNKKIPKNDKLKVKKEEFNMYYIYNRYMNYDYEDLKNTNVGINLTDNLDKIINKYK